jgi:hypothetical protein
LTQSSICCAAWHESSATFAAFHCRVQGIIIGVKSARILAYLLCLASLASCRSPQDGLTDVATSHVEANVPPSKVFDELLKRDLGNYFCRNSKDCTIEYEFLRDGPTQSGASYPKYYLWVKTIKGSTVAEEGAARVAAVEQKGFDVTHFLSREEISKSPSHVASIFPSALVDKITEKARDSFNSHN